MTPRGCKDLTKQSFAGTGCLIMSCFLVTFKRNNFVINTYLGMRAVIILFATFIVAVSANGQNGNPRKSLKLAGVVIDIPDTAKTVGLLKRGEWPDRDHDVYYPNPDYFTPTFRSANQLYANSLQNMLGHYFTKIGFPFSNSEYLFDYENQSAKSDLELGAVFKRVYLLYYVGGGYMIEKVDATVDIEYQLFDNRTRKVVYKKMIRGVSGSFDTKYRYMAQAMYYIPSDKLESRGFIDVAIHRSISELLSDQEFKSLIESDTTNYQVIGSEKVLQISEVGSISDSESAIDQAIHSTCAIVVGNGHGSGFFISADGLILTCDHVVGNRKTVDIMINKGVTMQAKVLRSNSEFDVALLKLEGADTSPLPLHTAKDTKVGETVFSIGTPGSTDNLNTISRGIVSGQRIKEGKQIIQTDASVSPGNSGGPLLNEAGNVIGIVNAKLLGKGVEGVAFAIPIEVALEGLNIQIR